jgi:hypothetical protein
MIVTEVFCSMQYIPLFLQYALKFYSDTVTYEVMTLKCILLKSCEMTTLISDSIPIYVDSIHLCCRYSIHLLMFSDPIIVLSICLILQISSDDIIFLISVTKYYDTL